MENVNNLNFYFYLFRMTLNGKQKTSQQQKDHKKKD
jgi:hypothetical protein